MIGMQAHACMLVGNRQQTGIGAEGSGNMGAYGPHKSHCDYAEMVFEGPVLLVAAGYLHALYSVLVVLLLAGCCICICAGDMVLFRTECKPPYGCATPSFQAVSRNRCALHWSSSLKEPEGFEACTPVLHEFDSVHSVGSN